MKVGIFKNDYGQGVVEYVLLSLIVLLVSAPTLTGMSGFVTNKKGAIVENYGGQASGGQASDGPVKSYHGYPDAPGINPGWDIPGENCLEKECTIDYVGHPIKTGGGGGGGFAKTEIVQLVDKIIENEPDATLIMDSGRSMCLAAMGIACPPSFIFKNYFYKMNDDIGFIVDSNGQFTSVTKNYNDATVESEWDFEWDDDDDGGRAKILIDGEYWYYYENPNSQAVIDFAKEKGLDLEDLGSYKIRYEHIASTDSPAYEVASALFNSEYNPEDMSYYMKYNEGKQDTVVASFTEILDAEAMKEYRAELDNLAKSLDSLNEKYYENEEISFEEYSKEEEKIKEKRSELSQKYNEITEERIALSNGTELSKNDDGTYNLVVSLSNGEYESYVLKFEKSLDGADVYNIVEREEIHWKDSHNNTGKNDQ